MLLSTALMTAAGLATGSFMFSAWLVRLRGRDIREYGDRNPGAVNAFKACGPAVGIPALILDFVKGAIPVWLAKYVFGVTGFWLVPVALAPVLGHAFSPFLRFRGGKAVAVTFGIWCGLTLWEGPTVLGVGFAIAGLVQRNDAWTVVLGMLGMLGYWLVRGAGPAVLTVWAAVFVLMVWKHRSVLGQGAEPRGWLRRRKRAE